jgi:serine/threonine protein phosphatase 1
MKTFVLGDIHGGAKALCQVIKRSKFNKDKDRLICLGDVADGWPEVPEAIEELLTIKNLVYVRGNHDQWLKDWLKEGKEPNVWIYQGGQASKRAYQDRHPELIKKHLAFLKKTKFYFVDEKNRCYVHGGVQPNVDPKDTDKMFLVWDRSLWDDRNSADSKEKTIPQFDTVFVGHTSIYRFSHRPIKYGNVWFLDTGGGWEGILSIMNVDTQEVFQSDQVYDLYPESRGRM